MQITRGTLMMSIKKPSTTSTTTSTTQLTNRQLCNVGIEERGESLRINKTVKFKEIFYVHFEKH